MRRFKFITICVITGLILMAVSSVIAGPTINLSSATSVSFQDEGTISVDNTSLLIALDGQWAPSVGGTVTQNYYATGTSPSWWDAVSLNFDLSSVGWDNIASAELWFYTQQGDYMDNNWHHYEILQGGYNASHEDLAPGSWPGLVDFGNHGNSGLVGWLNGPTPVSWITSDSLDVTLRVWNARIDKIELRTTLVPVPGAVLLSGIGVSLVGWIKRRKAL